MECETLGDNSEEIGDAELRDETDESVVLYCSPTHEEFLQKKAEHEYATKSKFIIRSHTKKVEDVKATLAKRSKLQWLGNVPYIWLQSTVYVCHQGRDVNKSGKRKYAEMRDSMAQTDPQGVVVRRYNKRQASKKLNCPARIRLKRIVRFMNHKLTDFTEGKKRYVTTEIKQGIKNGTDYGEECFVYNLPRPEDHENHSLEGSSEPVDRRVRKFIKDLIIKGRRDIGGILELTYAFAEHNLKEYDRSRRRFYPSRKVIRGILAFMRKKLKQENNQEINQEINLKMNQEINQENQVYYFTDDMDVGEVEMETGNEFGKEEILLESENGVGPVAIELETGNEIVIEPSPESCTKQPKQLSNKQHLVSVMSSTLKSIRTTMRKLDETSLHESVAMMQNVLHVMESKIPNHECNGLPKKFPVKKSLCNVNMLRNQEKNNKLVLLQTQGQTSQVGVTAQQIRVAQIILISNESNDV